MSDQNQIYRRDILKLGSAGALGLAGRYFLNMFSSFTPSVQAQTHNKNHDMDINAKLGDA